MESQRKAPSLSLDVYASSAASVASVPAQAVFVPTQLPPRPTSSPSTLLPPTSIYPSNAVVESQTSGGQAIPHAEPTDTTAMQVPTKSELVVNDVAPIPMGDGAMAQLLASVETVGSTVIELMESRSQREQKTGMKGREEEVEDEEMRENAETEQKESRPDKSVSASKELDTSRSIPQPLLPSPPSVTTTVAADIDVGVVTGVEEKSKVAADDEVVDTVTQLSLSPPKSKSKPVVRVVRKRRCVSSTLQMMRSYADTLQPVDCVILVERCSPFSRNTRFMEYFKTEFLSKILSDLNGGPPVDTDFGRDSYTSLYSLHTFDWRNPEPPTTLVSDTAIIKSIFTALDTLQPSGVPPVARGDEGIPIVPLLRVALSLFDSLETHRRRALGLRLRRRHLILLLRSPCATLEPLEAEAAVLSGEAVAESSIVVAETAQCAEMATAGESVSMEGAIGESNMMRKGVLAQLRELRVAVSVFSPCEHKNLRRLAQMCNMLPPDIRRDLEWPTVIFSREISQVSLAQRHSSGPTGSRRSTAPLSPQLQQRLQQTPPQPTSALGSAEPSPRHPLQAQNQQPQQQHVPSSLPQQQQPPMVRHMVGDCSAPSPHQTRLPVPYPPGSNPMAAGSGQSHTAFSGPNSIEPAQSHHLHQGLQRSLGSGSGLTGPSSVPDALSSTYQVSPMAAQGYGLAPPLSAESQVSRPPHQPIPQQQQQQQPQQAPPPQQQYYSPVAPTPYDGESALSGLSPAMASDPYLRVNYPPNPSPMCSGANVGINSTTSATNDSQSTSGLQNSSEPLNSDHHHQQQQQAKQRPTSQQQQQQPVPSPYTIPSTPHSAEQTNVQYHLRQHPSPYQAPQQSPMTTNPVPVSTVVGGSYHPPSTLAYPMAEMSRYQSTGSPLNAMRPSAPTAPPGRVMGEERALLWEGQLNVRGQMLAYVQIFFEVTAPRMNFPWQKSSCLMLQLEQVDRDSQMGQILSHHISSYLLPTKLVIAFKAGAISHFKTPDILSTEFEFIFNLFNGSIAPGVIAFVCLLCTDDGHVIGLMPKDSETFRGDMLLRQLHRCQRVVPERQQQQYDAGLLEMQTQQQQPSPAYSTNTPSLPNTPSKMVRPSTATPSPLVGRSGGGSGSGSMPSRVGGGGGGVMIEENEMVQQQQQPQHFMTAYQQIPPQQQQQMQQQQQQSQMPRQPLWQDQRQAGAPSDLIQQQQQPRPYQTYQHPPQQQMMMSSGPGGQSQQQQHLYQPQGVPTAQSTYMQQKIPGVMSQQQQQQQQLQRPQTYPGLVTPRQQLRDASGRFQSSSAAAAAAAAAATPPGGQEYHTPPLPPSYPPTAGAPMYDMPQQYAGMTPTPRMSAYVRPSPAMRPGFPRMNSAAAAAAAYVARAPVSRAIPRGMGVRGISQPHLVMPAGPGEGMIYENPMDQQVQTQQQQQQGVFEPNAAASSSTPHNQPPMF
ncbi:unnamed protein product [Taenia asiatica]|uniref:Med25_VWA domain-containing protein n=1 Tax=Taenia asiatica TaxID=60517 RepID=A0A158R703_TAEAS|nr:unnamed protein product [Taenia asiatica]